jgi:hypothetical protein
MPITSNIEEVIAGLKARQDKVDAACKLTAEQCGVLAKGYSDPMTPVKSSTLQGTIIPEVSQIAPCVYQLWFGSHGAFGKDSYNYAPIQEFYFGMIAGGWFTMKQDAPTRWQTNMAELKNG